jgi:hypothetical protein
MLYDFIFRGESWSYGEFVGFGGLTRFLELLGCGGLEAQRNPELNMTVGFHISKRGCY